MTLANAQMASASQQSLIEKLELYAILGLLFFIPISPAAPNLLGLALIALWVWKGDFRASWNKVKQQPIFWAFLAYLLIYPLSLLWSQNQAWGWHLVERHMIFLIFPFLLMASRYEDIPKYLAAFILGMTVTEFTSYLVWFEIIQIAGVSPVNPSPFYHHTIYNPMLAWALYLVLHGLLFEPRSLPIKLFFALFALTMTVNMFITAGRGGQVAFFIVTGLLLLQYFASQKMFWRGVVVSSVFVVGIFGVAYQTSGLFQQRVDLAIQEVKQFQPEDQTSVGTRIGFYLNTAQMAFNRPIEQVFLGSGIGDFPEDYTASLQYPNAVKLYAGTEAGQHSHPHNQYLYELGALGLVGLSIFLILFGLLVQLAWRIRDSFQHHRVAFLVYMFVVMLSDSLLLAHGTALLFIVFAAILFANPRVKVI